MFVDSVTVTLAAGSGGSGIVAWRREKYIPKGGPYGGNGGKGGDILLKTDSGIVSLDALRHRRHIQAPSGKQGGPNRCQGKSGENCVILLPCGTLVKDASSQAVLFDFTASGQEFLICRGGKGGKGNAFFRTSTNQTPSRCTPGLPGETLEVEFELKLIADVGLIGMPNAGKSTLMSKLTQLEVKIGAYPFTTLHPNLSYIQYANDQRVLVADIPGIIEGAHRDKGLGLAFLKHIERTATLIYVIDASGSEGRDPWNDFTILRSELKHYDRATFEKPFLVALNKTDLPTAQALVQKFKKKAKLAPGTLFEISALENMGIDLLKAAIKK